MSDTHNLEQRLRERFALVGCLLEHRLHPLLALAPEDGVQFLGDLLAQRVALGRIGRQQRGHDKNWIFRHPIELGPVTIPGWWSFVTFGEGTSTAGFPAAAASHTDPPARASTRSHASSAAPMTPPRRDQRPCPD